MLTLQSFPIHDAELMGINAVPRTNGRLSIRIDIRVHEDESLAQLAQFNLSQRSCRLTFENCWCLATDYFGLYTTAELIDRWEWIDEKQSDLIRRVRDMECGSSVAFQHHRLLFSGGSTINILAEDALVNGSPHNHISH